VQGIIAHFEKNTLSNKVFERFLQNPKDKVRLRNGARVQNQMERLQCSWQQVWLTKRRVERSAALGGGVRYESVPPSDAVKVRMWDAGGAVRSCDPLHGAEY